MNKPIQLTESTAATVAQPWMKETPHTAVEQVPPAVWEKTIHQNPQDSVDWPEICPNQLYRVRESINPHRATAISDTNLLDVRPGKKNGRRHMGWGR